MYQFDSSKCGKWRKDEFAAESRSRCDELIIPVGSSESLSMLISLTDADALKVLNYLQILLRA